MSPVAAIKKRLRGRDDEALRDDLVRLEAKAAALRSTQTREDVAEAIDRWLATAKSVASRRVIPTLAGGGLGFSEQAIFDAVASIVLASPEARTTLYRLAEPRDGWPLRERRDAELATVEAEIRDLRVEIERRAVEAEKTEAARRIADMEARLNAAANGDRAA